MRFQFRGAAIILMTGMSVLALNGAAAESVCYVPVGKGALENGVKLPLEGKNFSAYSSAGSLAGRTHVHSAVEKIVVAAYARLAVTGPHKVFVYRATRWGAGAPTPPPRPHPHCALIPFIVPLVQQDGHSG